MAVFRKPCENAILFPTAIVLFCIIGGCGEPVADNYSVSGTVSYNNQPLPNGILRFVPQKGQPSPPIVIGVGGSYKTKLPAGNYRIEVTAVQTPAGQDASGQAQEPGPDGKPIAPVVPQRWLIPKKYSRFDTSGLTATVQENEDNTINVQMR